MKDLLLKNTLEAVDKLHNDRSVSQKETLNRLEEVREHIDVLIEALKCSVEDEE